MGRWFISIGTWTALQHLVNQHISRHAWLAPSIPDCSQQSSALRFASRESLSSSEQFRERPEGKQRCCGEDSVGRMGGCWLVGWYVNAAHQRFFLLFVGNQRGKEQFHAFQKRWTTGRLHWWIRNTGRLGHPDISIEEPDRSMVSSVQVVVDWACCVERLVKGSV